MSLTSALNYAASGISVNAKRAATVSDNIANALSPGYTARANTVSAVAIGGRSGGVEIGVATRQTHPYLTVSRMAAEAATSGAAALASATDEIARIWGDPGDTRAISTMLQSLEDAFAAAAARPDQTALLTAAQNAAGTIAKGFNAASSAFMGLRLQADGAIAQSVSDMNRALKDVENLNREIVLARAMNSSTAALEDRRQQAVDTLNAAVPVKVLSRSNGAISVISQTGTMLLDERAKQFEFDPAATIDPASSLQNGALSGLMLDGKPYNYGASESGSLAVQFLLRDRLLPDALAQLDSLAADLANRFQNPAVDPTVGATDPALFTDFGGRFEAVNTQGLASRFRLNDQLDLQGTNAWRLRAGMYAVSPGLAGDETRLRVQTDAMREPQPGAAGLVAASAQGLAAQISGIWAETAINADAALSAATAGFEHFTLAEKSANGVDSDGELQQLMLIEKAYAANAKVLGTLDDLLQQILEI
ncbi:MAG TPA: flagellar hook-associated protein FlgK [Paracoccaceae bacterium]|nr:flagellar hook-associated protein FlgK [Paracoccaceae bacterium]